MKVIDLSRELYAEIPLYPGTNSPSIETLFQIDPDGCTVTRVSFDSHTGTHIDAPAHMLPDGPTMENIPAEAFAGSGCVLDFRGHGQPEIGLGHIQAHAQALEGCDYAVLRTGWEEYWDTPQYLEGFPILSLEAAEWLANLGIKGVAMDCISPDVVETTEFPVHKAILAKDALVVENLCNLGELPAKGFLFCAFPIKIKGGNGCPVRAVGLIP